MHRSITNGASYMLPREEYFKNTYRILRSCMSNGGDVPISIASSRHKTKSKYYVWPLCRILATPDGE